MNAAPLERPVWSMLTGPQAGLAVATGAAVRIDPRYGPFAAARDQSDAAQVALAAMLTGPDDTVWLVEREEWPAPAGTSVVRVASLLQMVADNPAPLRTDDGPFVALGADDVAEMTDLAFAT